MSATEMWPFSEVNNKVNISVNGGWHFDSDVGVMAFGVTIKGFHLTIGGVGNCRWPKDIPLDNEDSASAILQFGYQIPVVKAFRVIPVVGTAALGKIAYKRDYDGDNNANEDKSDGGTSANTKLDMRYKFDYGAHFVFNYRKLVFNAAITRYIVFGGIGVEF